MPTSQTSSGKSTVKLKKPVVSKAKPSASTAGKFVTPEKRFQMIAEAAYYKAEHRGFAPGGTETDWLCAENEIDEMLTNQ